MIDATVNNQANINNVVAIQTVINNNVTTSSTSTSSINGIVNNDNNNNIGLCLSLTQWNNIVADLHEIETTMEDNGMINIACLVILGAQILILIVACILLRKVCSVRKKDVLITLIGSATECQWGLYGQGKITVAFFCFNLWRDTSTNKNAKLSILANAGIRL